MVSNFWWSRTWFNNYSNKTISNLQSSWHLLPCKMGDPRMSSLKHLSAINHNEKILSYVQNRLIYSFTFSTSFPLSLCLISSSPHPSGTQQGLENTFYNRPNNQEITFGRLCFYDSKRAIGNSEKMSMAIFQ